MLAGLISGIFHALPKPIVSLPMRQLGTMFNAAPTTGAVIAGGSWSLMPIRNKMRYHFPRARESKRIKTYGWAKRMSTPEGRRVLMRRILRGRHVLSH